MKGCLYCFHCNLRCVNDQLLPYFPKSSMYLFIILSCGKWWFYFFPLPGPSSNDNHSPSTLPSISTVGFVIPLQCIPGGVLLVALLSFINSIPLTVATSHPFEVLPRFDTASPIFSGSDIQRSTATWQPSCCNDCVFPFKGKIIKTPCW